MAFPGTYDITYYKGDTFQFRIYPKNADGTAFNLAPYTGGVLGGSTLDEYNLNGTQIPYDNAMFVFAPSRGSTEWHQALAWISPDKTYVGCAIRGGEDGDSQYLTAGVEYVYDVQVTKPTNDDPDSPFTFPVINTLLTGKITVQGQVTP